MPLHIRIHGEEYWLQADSLDDPGSVCTPDQCNGLGDVTLGVLLLGLYDDNYLSYAFYYPDDGVYRRHAKIADRTEIEVITNEGSNNG